VLSLLQYKPAPMYILDEVDAALDLSHTQNIGHLFSTRFKGSQFIVVSLKDGMFANANVIFRAKFVNGTSMVERTMGKKALPACATTSAQRESDKENQKAATREGDALRNKRNKVAS
jgi:structural maintenance of chromosome 2